MCALLLSTKASAQNDTLDISGNNTSSSYVTYNKTIRISAGKCLDVLMARYCYFSSKITGKGVLNLYGGGERCFLGTDQKEWPDWTSYTGDVHIRPFRANSSSAGSYGVVLVHGGKSSTAENALDDAKSGKLNPTMANKHVTLHEGATMTCEANTNGAGFHIGELNSELGSTLSGYYKKSRSAYYLLGGLDTDFTLAGTIKPTDYDNATLVGIVKEGKGTLTITGNDNYVSGALRVLDGRVLVSNDRLEAQQGKKRGGLGARPSDSEAIAYVFEGGVLGGTGSIAGSVDNYGVIEPGDDQVGVLTLQNYVTASQASHLTLHPASVLRFKVDSLGNNDMLVVNGTVKLSTMQQDFTTSDKQPVISLAFLGNVSANIGDEYLLLTAKGKPDGTPFELKQPGKYTWELVEEITADGYTLKVRVVSLQDAGNSDNPDNPDNPDQPGMGAFYDDGIDDVTDNHTLDYYAEQCGKNIGVALCTYKGYQSDRDEAARQFNMMVCENEMKMDALQPSQGSFSYGSADNLVTLARNNNMTVRGHCLVWHQQQPTWLSSDGKKNDKNWTRQQALELMKNHITKVMQHFKGKVTEWDVVNECLDDDQSIIRTNPDGYTLRQTVWQRAIGNDYIDSAFVYAHRADPDAVLYLNEYDVEHQGKAKTVAYMNLAKHLKSRNIPIDGVGLQCHFSVGEVDSVKLDTNIKNFAAEGLKCIITELDMGVPSTSTADLEEQARLYRVITDIMLNNDNCPSMVIWGIKDNDSWRSGSNPLLYTSGLSKKPAWYAVRSALRHRTLTSGVREEVMADGETFANSPIYDLQGRQVANGKSANRKLSPGLYIISGKKVVIK